MALDPLGSALTGPLFATAAMREVFSDGACVVAMLRVEAALARVQARVGLAPEPLAPAIEAIDPARFDAAALGAETALAGVPVIPFVKALQRLLPPELEPHVHKGATSQDIADTALALMQRDALSLLAADGSAVLAGLSALAARHRGEACAGRSYGQQAAPVTFGFKVAVWAAGIAEVLARLPEIRGRACAVSLGGPVGTLAGLGDKGPAVADALADELGLASSPIAWHVRRARVAETGAWLATLLGALAKLSVDVVDLASTEVGEVAEPHVAGRGGSSAMPHKRNPIAATVILAAAGAAKGHVATLLESMAAGHERPAGAWQAEWLALPPLFGLASGALAEARRLAEGLVVDRARLAANLGATRGLLFADAAAARLATSLGRAAAHATVERAAARVRSDGTTLAAALAADAAAEGIDLAPAFDLAPAVAAAQPWIDRALAEVARVRALLA
ncbi:MAG: adenylosuccinate lyase family protein [Alphaproteobacteria bacterium]|nr:adenylosuccinate lyase family protein [Alphaproteobacteria bacterium]